MPHRFAWIYDRRDPLGSSHVGDQLFVRFSPTMTRRDAWGLVEMVVVLLVMAIAAAIAAPKFSRVLDRTRVDSAASRLAGDIRQASRVARVQSVDTSIEFFPNSAMYRGQTTDPANPSTVVLTSDCPGLVMTVSANLSTATITFDADGYADTSGYVDLVCRGNRRRVYWTPAAHMAAWQ